MYKIEIEILEGKGGELLEKGNKGKLYVHMSRRSSSSSDVV